MANKDDLKNNIDRLIGRYLKSYDMEICDSSSSHVRYANELSSVSFTFDRYGIGPSTIIEDRLKSIEYSVINVVIFLNRNHDFKENASDSPDAALRLEESMIETQKLLTEYCTDMLHGDFSVLQSGDGYEHHMKKLKRYAQVVVKLPKGDSIRQKYWDFDNSWIDDFEKRFGQSDI